MAAAGIADKPGALRPAITPYFPFRIEFEVLGVCNLHCRYCFAQPLSGTIPPLIEIEYLFRKTKDEADPFDVIVVGGEPFLRKDIFELLALANRTFANFGVSTNGTLLHKLSKLQLSELRQIFGDRTLQVSLDGLTALINDSVRGSTELVLRGLDTLEEGRVNFAISTALTTINSGSVAELIRELVRKYRYLKSFNLMPLMPSGCLGTQYAALKLNLQKHVAICSEARAICVDEGRQDVDLRTGLEKCTEETMLNNYGLEKCLAGFTRAAVLPNGDVTPCPLVRRMVIGNLHRESWSDIWMRSLTRHGNSDWTGRACDVNLNSA